MGASKNNIQAGDIFGYWKVLSYAGQDANGKRLWLCLCTKCGKATSVIRASKLVKGRSLACMSCCHVTHGLSKSPEYRACLRAQRRCMNPDDAEWPWYGGDPIKPVRIAKEWQGVAGVLAMTLYVLKTLGPRPPGCQLDRINNAGDYTPGNLRWATPSQNCRNRRNNRPITWNGQTKLLCEWSEELGIPRGDCR